MNTYIYLKTHNVTGLKYLGKTIRDPHEYKGSGIVWTRHLEKHGDDISTTILKTCQSKKELKEWGLYYSNKWDVVESKEFANLTPEEGQGGNTYDKTGKKRKPYKTSTGWRKHKFQVRHGKPVVVYSKKYKSAHEAMRQTGIPKSTILYRCHSSLSTWSEFSFDS